MSSPLGAEVADQRAVGIRRSLLLAPAHDHRAVEIAITSGADAICLDLEDTVPPDRKAEARETVAAAVQRCSGHADVLVRLNSAAADVEADLEACVRSGLDGVRMPKAEDPATVRWLAERLSEREREHSIPSGRVGISLLIESVQGLFASRQLVASDGRVVGISLGHEDFAHDLGVEPTSTGQESLLAELGLVLVAREASVHPLGVLGRRDGEESVRSRCAWLRQVGFRGAATTDATAVPLINSAFTPAEAELARARVIVDAYQAGLGNGVGILTVSGVGMVDLPVAMRAQGLLDQVAAMSRKNST